MEPINRSNCPIARTVQLMGDQWSPLILRELFLEGPRRFRDFEEVLGLSPNTLSAKLKRLEAAGVVARRMYCDHPPRAEYYLTEKGQTLSPVLKVLHDWGSAHTLGMDRELSGDPD